MKVQEIYARHIANECCENLYEPSVETDSETVLKPCIVPNSQETYTGPNFFPGEPHEVNPDKFSFDPTCPREETYPRYRDGDEFNANDTYPIKGNGVYPSIDTCVTTPPPPGVTREQLCGDPSGPPTPRNFPPIYACEGGHQDFYNLGSNGYISHGYHAGYYDRCYEFDNRDINYPKCASHRTLVNVPGFGDRCLKLNENTPPEPSIVVFPSDVVKSKKSVTLDGSRSSDPDRGDSISSYTWNQTGGPPVALSFTRSAITSFTAPVVDTTTVLTFELSVVDTHGGLGIASKSITVQPSRPPIANSGPDQIGKKEGDLIQLDGSGSKDPDPGDEIIYSWEQIGGSQVKDLRGTDGSNPTFVMPKMDPINSNPVKFKLTVKDLDGQTNTDEVEIKYGCPVDVYMDAFIPYAKVKTPDPTAVHSYYPYRPYHAYGGDNHMEPIKKGSARIWYTVEVDLCKPENPLIDKKHGVGLSKAYYYTKDKYGRITGEAFDSKYGDTSSLKEQISVIQGQIPKVNVHITASAPIPFGLMPPTVDLDINIQLNRIGSNVVYAISGTHDGFPDYSIFIGDKNVYFHDVVKAGTSPLISLPSLYINQWNVRENCGSCIDTVPLDKAYSP